MQINQCVTGSYNCFSDIAFFALHVIDVAVDMGDPRMVGENLINALCPRKNYLPYWQMVVGNDYRGRYEFRDECNAHNIGRWWDAVLRLEDAVGFAIPLEAEAGMLANLQMYCGNPWGILLDVDDDPDDAAYWYIHSFRETMLAFWALVNFRQNRQVIEAGRRAAKQMNQACKDLTNWDFSPTKQPYCKNNQPVYSHGRALEGLVYFYQATGDELTLRLADRVACYHLEHTTNPDGSLATEHGNHMHSYLNTLRGLLQYGLLTGQREYIDAVEATYHNTLAELITPSGYITHDIDIQRLPFAMGEVASAGDMAQLALWLFQCRRDPRLLDDVERIVRSRILPSQVVDVPPIQAELESDQDEYRDLGQRMVGALGAVGHTYGKSCITDITAATLHSLIDVYNHIVERRARDIWIHLHFDYAQDGITVRSSRKEQATVTVEVAGDENVFVRIPTWTPADSVHLKVNGKICPAQWNGSYLSIAGRSQGTRVEISYSLPTHTEQEISWTQYFDSSERLQQPTDHPRQYTIQWRGDEIIGACPIKDYFPIYQKLNRP